MVFTGLRFRGEEECAHCPYDIALTVLERDTLVYLGPEKFPTRRNELQLKKPVAADCERETSRFYLFHKHRAGSSKCLSQEGSGIRSRGNMFIQHHDKDLLDHLHTPPPPGYSPISIRQILRADRATFIFLAERMTSLKRDATNRIPMVLALPNMLGQLTVAFHLLPVAGAAAKAASSKEKPRKDLVFLRMKKWKD